MITITTTIEQPSPRKTTATGLAGLTGMSYSSLRRTNPTPENTHSYFELAHLLPYSANSCTNGMYWA